MKRRKFLGMIAAAPVVAAMPKLAMADTSALALDSAATHLACFWSSVLFLPSDGGPIVDLSAAMADVLPLIGVPKEWLRG